MLNQKNKSGLHHGSSHGHFAYFTFLPVSFMGFIDASYLSIKHFVGTPLPCSVLRGCEEVTTSQYSVIGGVPVALLGAIYYLAIFALIFGYLRGKRYTSSGNDSTIQKNDDRMIKMAARLTIIGILASLWFIYLQLFVIKAICLYCMFSALTSSLLFAFGIYVLKFRKTPQLV